MMIKMLIFIYFLVFHIQQKKKWERDWVSQRWSTAYYSVWMTIYTHVHIDKLFKIIIIILLFAYPQWKMKWSGFTLIGCLDIKRRSQVKSEWKDVYTHKMILKDKRQSSERKWWVPGLFINTQQASSSHRSLFLQILCTFSSSFNVSTFHVVLLIFLWFQL